MDRAQMEMLIELMELEFALTETALYLNTHPNDERALRIHNNNSAQYYRLKEAYEMQYGLLTNQGMSGYPWNYVDEPWPWDIDFIRI